MIRTPGTPKAHATMYPIFRYLLALIMQAEDQTPVPDLSAFKGVGEAGRTRDRQ